VPDTFIILDNLCMTTDTRHPIDADTEALLERIAGKPLDPEVYRRIQERGNKVTEEIRKRMGTIEIAIDLIRETRDECV
jgi:hypothetical protein